MHPVANKGCNREMQYRMNDIPNFLNVIRVKTNLAIGMIVIHGITIASKPCFAAR